MPAQEAASLDDFELLQRTAAGDRAAYGAFVERHQAAVFQHATWLLPQRADAEDVLQETFLSALRSAGQYRGDASARTWLFTIARNAALRKLPRSTPVTSAEDATLESLAVRAGWGHENPESLAILAQDRRRLEEALAGLSAEEREVLLLRDREGTSGDDTAAMLGITLTAMKSRLHRARIRLAAALRAQPGRKP